MNNQEITPETTKNPEIEQIFNRIEKVPYGGVLVSLFKENSESWEVKDDRDTILQEKNDNIYGKVKQIKYGSYTPIMKLEPPGYREAKARLKIFNGIEKYPDYNSHNILIYAGVYQSGPGSSPEINMGIFFDLIDAKLPFGKYWGEEIMRYNSYLIEIANKAGLKSKEVIIPKEIEEKVMEKWNRCGAYEAGYILFGDIFSL